MTESGLKPRSDLSYNEHVLLCRFAVNVFSLGVYANLLSFFRYFFQVICVLITEL